MGKRPDRAVIVYSNRIREAYGDVPIIIFDAYTYANYPFYMANIDRTNERVNVWKIDEANNVYNFQVPFTEPT